MNHTVSIVLPTYNRAHLLPRAIRSVLRQTHSNWELFVVDDRSSDSTPSVIKDFGDPRISYLRHETNRGASAARNTGIHRANGDYIAFIDSDNEWHPGKLEKQLAVFERTTLTSLAVVTCGIHLISRDAASSRFPIKSGWIFDDLLRRRIGIWDTNTFLVRRRGMPPFFFDEELPACQDFDYLARVAQKYTLDYVDEVLVNCYENDPGPRVSDHKLEGRIHILKKYASALAARPQTLSEHHARIGILYHYQNNMPLARKHFLRAAVACPKRLDHWFRFAAACLGKHTLCLLLTGRAQLRSCVRWALRPFRRKRADDRCGDNCTTDGGTANGRRAFSEEVAV